MAAGAVATATVTPYLDIRDWDGGLSQVPLVGRHLIVGRAPDAQIRLDRPTVSRHHAEIVCDPFGRWLIRDLESRNGIRVRGTRVPELPLRPGEAFELGQFTVTFQMPQPGVSDTRITTATGGDVSVSDSDVVRLSTFEGPNRPRIAASHLSTLMRFGRELFTIEESSERLLALCRLMVGREWNGTVAMAVRVNRSAPEAHPQMLVPPQTPGGGSREQAPYVSRRLLRHMAERNEPVIASNFSSAGGGPQMLEMSMVGGGGDASMSAVACPLHADEHVVDFLYVTLPPQYGTHEWLAIAALAAEQYRLAESGWQARRQAQMNALIERELEKARQIQLRLVPQQVEIPGLDVAVGFEACRWVGGDYVDVVSLPDGRALLVVADVCGKGLPAAMVATSLRTMVRTGARAGLDLAPLVGMVRQQLPDTLPEYSFVTMIAIAIDPRTGEMECLSAGHPPAFVVSPGGQARRIQCPDSYPLGIGEEPLDCCDERLNEGELLVMYSDGVSELRSIADEMFSIERLGAEVASVYGRPAEQRGAAEVARELTGLLEKFRSGRLADDDQTFLLARRT
jgi:serine phosphatase RsbU (regulator of sigma subunit)